MSDVEYRQASEKAARKKMAVEENLKGRPSKREKGLAKADAAVGGKASFGERGAARLSKTDAPFVRMSGWIVRGTDESSFLMCGSQTVHYTRMAVGAISQVVQRYRFQATAPLSPIYFSFDGRIVTDSVTIGEHKYTSVVEIDRVYPELPGQRPACAPPRRGSLIEGAKLSVAR